MTCAEIEARLAEVATGHGDAAARHAVDEHTATCAACARALADASAAWTDLDAWPSGAAPRPAVIDQIHAELAARAPARAVVPAIVLGLGVSAAGFAVLHLRTGLALGAGSLACAGIWAGAFALAFFAIPSRRYARGARAALWTSAALLVLALICPAGEMTEACVRSGALGGGAVPSFAIGLLYGLVAATAGLAATRSQRAGRALVTIGAVAAFELPVLYLQCQSFAAGALATTLAGGAVASVIAGVAEHGWARRAT